MLEQKKRMLQTNIRNQMFSSPYRLTHDAPHWPPALDMYIEQPGEVERRVVHEREARLASERIDRALALERARKKKKKDVVKILLLGQAESGKSTTLKNFQLHFTPRRFEADAGAWRTVIYLNLLRSVNYLLDLLNSAAANCISEDVDVRRPIPILLSVSPSSTPEQKRPRTADGPRMSSVRSFDSPAAVRPCDVYSVELRRLMLSLLPLKSVEEGLNTRLGVLPQTPPVGSYLESSQGHRRSSSEARESIPSVFANSTAPKTISFVDKRNRSAHDPPRPSSSQSTSSSSSGSFSPTKSKVKSIFVRRPSASTPAPTHSRNTKSVDLDSREKLEDITNASESGLNVRRGWVNQVHRSYSVGALQPFKLWNVAEFAVKVRGNAGWKQMACLAPRSGSGRPLSAISTSADVISIVSAGKNTSVTEIVYRPDADTNAHEEHELEVSQHVIQACGEDIEKLWRNQEVQELLKQAGIQLVNQPGFFLDDVLRITSPDYVPTTDDILRARLSTVGVEEHKLVMETNHESGKEWIIYDVGGSRSQRAAWAPFFDSVTAIIFLAPISSFDEWLVEDPTVNRLEDTLQLWRTICRNRLLASVGFILFLNKFDILGAKLKSGVRFAKYVSNYKDQPNNADSVAKFMLSAFNAAHRQLSPKPRQLHAYLTSVIDSRATSKVLVHIREQVIVNHLAQTSLI